MRVTRASWRYKSPERISGQALLTDVGEFLQVRVSRDKMYQTKDLLLMGALLNKLDKGTDSREDQVCRAAWGMCHDFAFLMDGWGDADGTSGSLEKNRETVLKLVPEDFYDKKRVKELILAARDDFLDPDTQEYLVRRGISTRMVKAIFQDVDEELAEMMADKVVIDTRRVAYRCDKCGRDVSVAECRFIKTSLKDVENLDELRNAARMSALGILISALFIYKSLLDEIGPSHYIALFLVLFGLMHSTAVQKKDRERRSMIAKAYFKTAPDPIKCTRCGNKLCYNCVKGVDYKTGRVFCADCNSKKRL